MKHLKSASFVATVLLSSWALVACGDGGKDSGDDGGTGGASDGSGGTGSGGGPGGANGSGGGDPGPTSVCDKPGATTKPASPQVSDLENEDADTALIGWDAYQSTPDDADTYDAVVTQPEDYDASSNRAPVLEADGPDEDNAHSVHYAGSGWYSYGAGVNYGLGAMGECKDLSDYDGVIFWAKGSTTPGAAGEQLPAGAQGPKENDLIFRVITPGSHADADGGDCVLLDGNPNKCFNPPQTTLTITEEWTQYKVKFSSLSTTVPASAYSGRAMLLGWHSLPGDFDFQISGVSYCAGAECD